jgi:hypothetical protein
MLTDNFSNKATEYKQDEKRLTRQKLPPSSF